MKKVNNNKKNKKTISNRHRYLVTETNEKEQKSFCFIGLAFFSPKIFNERTIQRKTKLNFLFPVYSFC